MDSFLLSEKERSRGWGILACKLLQLVREVLKRKVQVQRRCVLFDKLARLAPALLRLRLRQANRHLPPRRLTPKLSGARKRRHRSRVIYLNHKPPHPHRRRRGATAPATS